MTSPEPRGETAEENGPSHSRGRRAPICVGRVFERLPDGGVPGVGPAETQVRGGGLSSRGGCGPGLSDRKEYPDRRIYAPHGSAINPDGLTQARLGGHDDLILEHNLIVLFRRAMAAHSSKSKSWTGPGAFDTLEDTPHIPGVRLTMGRDLVQMALPLDQSKSMMDQAFVRSGSMYLCGPRRRAKGDQRKIAAQRHKKRKDEGCGPRACLHHHPQIMAAESKKARA